MHESFINKHKLEWAARIDIIQNGTMAPNDVRVCSRIMLLKTCVTVRIVEWIWEIVYTLSEISEWIIIKCGSKRHTNDFQCNAMTMKINLRFLLRHTHIIFIWNASTSTHLKEHNNAGWNQKKNEWFEKIYYITRLNLQSMFYPLLHSFISINWRFLFSLLWLVQCTKAYWGFLSHMLNEHSWPFIPVFDSSKCTLRKDQADGYKTFTSDTVWWIPLIKWIELFWKSEHFQCMNECRQHHQIYHAWQTNRIVATYLFY